MNRFLSFAIVATLLVACAKSERAPLPGDTVDADGGVQLTPKSMPLAKPESATPPRAPAPELGAIESRVFLPELVMEHQVAIGLKPEQRTALQKEVERGQKEMLAVQWDLSREKEKLAALLDTPKVDEAKAAAAAAELMKREDAIKSSHLAMLVRVKNLLTPEQQTKLRELRAEASRSR